MITIGLADDHNVVRQGLRLLLEGEPDLSVVGEAADGLEAVKLVEAERPEVLVVDLMMPGINGLEVSRQVGQRFPDTRVVILSMHDNEAYVLQALRSGAAGYVLKDADGEELVQAVRTVVTGRRYLSSALSERALDAYVQKAQEAPLEAYETLTTREREVLHLAAEGMTNAQIAERLVISPRTVEVHRRNLMRKLSLHKQADLIRFALQQGIIPLES